MAKKSGKKLAIEYMPIDSIKLNPKNPRKNDDAVGSMSKEIAIKSR